MSERDVLVEHTDGLTQIALNRAEHGNAITVAAMRELIDGLREAHQKNSLVVVLRGSGADFTTGRDQSEKPAGLTRAQSLSLILEANELLTTLPGISVTVVNGRALGFGSGLAAQSDITLAADDATFGFDEIAHGLAPLVVAEYLPRYVGPKAAGELIFTGRLLDAPEAHQLGIVNRVVPAAQLTATADALVKQLRAYEPGALRLMKRYVLDHRGGALIDPQGEAVTRLDEWLTAGRPPHPYATDTPESAEPAN